MKESEIRYNAARLLGRIAPEARAAVPALTELLRDEHDIVRVHATSALKAIDKQSQ